MFYLFNTSNHKIYTYVSVLEGQKGAVKRKSSLITAARRRTGGGIDEDLPELLIAQAISQQLEVNQAIAQALDKISGAIRDLINK